MKTRRAISIIAITIFVVFWSIPRIENFFKFRLLPCEPLDIRINWSGCRSRLQTTTTLGVMAISPDESLLTIDFTEGRVLVYPVEGSEIGEVQIIELENDILSKEILYPTELAISSDNSKLAILIYNRYLQIRDLSDGSLVSQVDINPDYEMPLTEELLSYSWHESPLLLDFSTDGQFIAVTHSNRRNIHILETSTGDEVAKMKGRRIAFSSQDNLLATLQDGGLITLWNFQSGEIEELKTMQIQWQEDENNEFIQFSPDGKKLATGGFRICSSYAYFQIWDVDSTEQLHSILGPLPEYDDGRKRFSVGRNHAWHHQSLYHFDGEVLFWTLDSDPTHSGFGQMNAPPGFFNVRSVSPPVGAYTQRWNAETGEKLLDIESKTSGFVVEEFLDFVHSPKNEALYILTSNHHLEVWELDPN